jgi:hypothetical protein
MCYSIKYMQYCDFFGWWRRLALFTSREFQGQKRSVSRQCDRRDGGNGRRGICSLVLRKSACFALYSKERINGASVFSLLLFSLRRIRFIVRMFFSVAKKIMFASCLNMPQL